MLLMELFGSHLVMERGDIDLQNDIEDILLQARKNNIRELTLAYIAGELNDINMYISPNDEEFKKTLVDVLQQNDWVEYADVSGKVIMKNPEEMGPDYEDPGEDMIKNQEKRSVRAEKTAMKNIKSSDKNEF